MVTQSCLTLCDLVDCDLVDQSPLSIEFSRQESWSRLPFPTPRDLPYLGIKPRSLASNLHLLHLLYWQAGSLPLSHLEAPY